MKLLLWDLIMKTFFFGSITENRWFKQTWKRFTFWDLAFRSENVLSLGVVYNISLIFCLIIEAWNNIKKILILLISKNVMIEKCTLFEILSKFSISPRAPQIYFIFFGKMFVKIWIMNIFGELGSTVCQDFPGLFSNVSFW